MMRTSTATHMPEFPTAVSFAETRERSLSAETHHPDLGGARLSHNRLFAQ
jgi:hypothetical protein